MAQLTRRGFMGTAGAAAAAVAGTSLEVMAAPSPDDAPGPKFKLGLVTYMVGSKWDLPTLIDVCKKSGVAAVELRTTHAHGVEPSLSADQRAEVRKRFEDAGVVLWGLGSVC